MWIVSNGAPKNGSTWLFQLIKVSKDFHDVPERYQNPEWTNSSVLDKRVKDAVRELGPSPVRYASKQHWKNRFAELLPAPGLKVMNIVRDARDTLVSRFHYDMRVENIHWPLDQYIKRRGRMVLAEYCTYQDYWISAARECPESYFISSYEHLSFDLNGAAAEIYKFIGVDVNPAQVKKLASKTHISRKKKVGEGQFFRKGKAFSYKEEITRDEEALILNICHKYDLLRIKGEIARYNPSLTAYLERTDVGL